MIFKHDSSRTPRYFDGAGADAPSLSTFLMNQLLGRFKRDTPRIGAIAAAAQRLLDPVERERAAAKMRIQSVAGLAADLAFREQYAGVTVKEGIGRESSVTIASGGLTIEGP